MTRRRTVAVPSLPAPMRKRPLSDRQRAFLDAVYRLARFLGRPPTAADVARELGITRKGARPQLLALMRKGYLTDVPVVIRAGYALTPTGEGEIRVAIDPDP